MDCLMIPTGTSMVRVFHAVPDAPAVDVLLNGAPTFEGVNYMNFTNYSPVMAGTYQLQLTAAGDRSQVLTNVTLTVPEGQILTVAAAGTPTAIKIVVLNDYENQTPVPSESIVRFVHLAAGVPAVDLYANEDLLARNLEYLNMTDYLSIIPGIYDISVRAAGSDQEALGFELPLSGNTISTVYVIGTPEALMAIQAINGSTYLCNSGETRSSNSMQ